MFAGALVLVPLALLLPVAVAVLVVLALTARPDGAIGPATAAARRHALLAGALAGVGAVGAVAATVWLGSERVALQSGRYLACMFLVAAVAHTLVLALGEITWPRPRGLVRSGRLERRGLLDVCPRVLLVGSTALVGATVAVLGATALLAAPDGRSLTASGRAADGALTVQAASPFPGSFYGGPVLVVLAVLVVLVWIALRLVVSRPAVTGADRETDLALRRASAHRVLRGAGASTSLTLGPVLALTGSSWDRVTGTALLPQVLGVGMLLTGVLVGVAGALLLLVPAPRVPAPAVAPPVPAVPA